MYEQDQTLGEPDLASAGYGAEPATPFGNPDGTPLSVGTQPLTLDELLASATLVERVGSICANGAMQARYDELVAALSELVTPQGEVIEDDGESDLAAQSNVARASALAAELDDLRREMAKSRFVVRFRAMPSDDWSAWLKQHQPKDGTDKVAMHAFRLKLIAATAIEPVISAEAATQLGKRLNASQIEKLSDTAWSACAAGGLDVPKSRDSWRNLVQR